MSNESNDNKSRSGFSNGSSCHHTKSKHYKNCVEDDSAKQVTVHKPMYEDELLKHRQNDSIAMDIQLIKGVLPDLFAVLKFLESDDDLAYNRIICHYFFKNYRLSRVNDMNGGREAVLQLENRLTADMLL